MNKFTKDELLAKICNFLLNPEIQFEKREILLRAKRKLENGQSVNRVLKSLYGDLRHIQKLGVNSLTGELLSFYDEISFQLYGQNGNLSNLSLESKEWIKKAKISALIGAILSSIISIIMVSSQAMIALQFSGYLNFNPANVTVFLIQALIVISHWLAFLKIDGIHGLGWSIYLLIIGVSTFLGSLVGIFFWQIYFFIFMPIFAIIILFSSLLAGVAWILSFVFSEKGKSTGKKI